MWKRIKNLDKLIACLKIKIIQTTFRKINNYEYASEGIKKLSMRKLLLTNTLILVIYHFLMASPILAEKPILSYFNIENIDTLPAKPKYQGYRIHLTAIKVMKRGDDWVKINFNAVNTGRHNINLSKKEQRYWVQFNFDQSIYEQKLGGIKEQIKEALFKEKFKLEAGKLVKNQPLKVSTLPSASPKIEQPSPEIVKTENTSSTKKKEASDILFTTKGKSEVTAKSIQEEKSQCPDLVIDTVIISEQSKKWATLEYTLVNIGKGPIQLYGKGDGNKGSLAIRGYISGVPRLSKGALPIGGKFVQSGLEASNGQLLPNEKYTGKVKLDISKKTRYMRSIILSLSGNILIDECDRTNNTKGLQLDL